MSAHWHDKQELADGWKVALVTLTKMIREGRVIPPSYFGSYPRWNAETFAKLLRDGPSPAGTHPVELTRQRAKAIEREAQRRAARLAHDEHVAAMPRLPGLGGVGDPMADELLADDLVVTPPERQSDEEMIAAGFTKTAAKPRKRPQAAAKPAAPKKSPTPTRKPTATKGGK